MKLATLLYIQNEKGEFLLMERNREPNKGLMSPPGGKLMTENAESPSQCAAREGFEECAILQSEEDWKLMGIVTEKNFPGIGSIMMFLMLYKKILNKHPPDCNEGSFQFIHPDNFKNFNIPVTDKLFLWEYILRKNDEPFILTIDCSEYPIIKQIII
ncbi:MAG: NUDIX domain-containing protein [bacterium]|nr:NUDIX domain-containing protein [bacterium]